MRSCLALAGFRLTATSMDKVCKYHKRRGQSYEPGQVVSDFCADAYVVAYPYCLALLYGASRGDLATGIARVRCPHVDGITMVVERVHHLPIYARAAKAVFDWAMRLIGHPVDWESYQIRIVVSAAGRCPAGITAGTTLAMNLRGVDELCPASFHGTYPLLLPFLAGVRPPMAVTDEIGLRCPDHEGISYTARLAGGRSCSR